MNITETLVDPVRPYTITATAHCVNCSPALRLFQLVNDAAGTDSEWENFDASSVPEYFTDGIKALRSHIDRLSDLSKPRRVEEDKNLWFMVESLIQARHLIDDMHSSKKSS